MKEPDPDPLTSVGPKQPWSLLVEHLHVYVIGIWGKGGSPAGQVYYFGMETDYAVGLLSFSSTWV